MKPSKFTFSTVILEILIVIVGISIAFWLNNWGEERKERALELEFIKTLKSELASDSVAFAYQAENNQETVDNLHRFLEILKQKDYENDSIPWFVGNFLNRSNWILNTNTYDILKSGGKLDIISNFQLRNELSGFYRVRGYQTEMLLDIIQDFTENHMNQYLTKNSNYFISDDPGHEFVRDREFQNLLAIWTIYNEQKLGVYSGILEEITHLITEFDKHLSN